MIVSGRKRVSNGDWLAVLMIQYVEIAGDDFVLQL